MQLEVLSAELGLLTATGRRLTAAQERRRAWLVAKIATAEAERDREVVAVIECEEQRERQAGVDNLRALTALWDALRLPTPFGEQRDY